MIASALLAAAVVVAAAPSDAGRLYAAPKVGYFVPSSRLGGSLFGAVELGWLTPLLERALSVSIEAEAYQPEAAGHLASPSLPAGLDGSYRLVQRELALLAQAVYRVSGIAALTPYAGAGFGVYWHRARVTALGATTTERSMGVGLQIVAGAERALGPGRVFLEAQLRRSNVALLSTGRADLGGLVAGTVGYRIWF
jgi:hypothetical protein